MNQRNTGAQVQSSLLHFIDKRTYQLTQINNMRSYARVSKEGNLGNNSQIVKRTTVIQLDDQPLNILSRPRNIEPSVIPSRVTQSVSNNRRADANREPNAGQSRQSGQSVGTGQNQFQTPARTKQAQQAQSTAHRLVRLANQGQQEHQYPANSPPDILNSVFQDVRRANPTNADNNPQNMLSSIFQDIGRPNPQNVQNNPQNMLSSICHDMRMTNPNTLPYNAQIGTDNPSNHLLSSGRTGGSKEPSANRNIQFQNPPQQRRQRFEHSMVGERGSAAINEVESRRILVQTLPRICPQVINLQI